MRRLLYIAHRVPYPPDKGERLRAFHEIKALSRHFHVTLAALASDKVEREAGQALRQWCQEVLIAPSGGLVRMLRGGLGLLAGGSVTREYFTNRQLLGRILRQGERQAFDIAMGSSSGVLPMLLQAPTKARILDLVDADSAKWRAYADSSSWPRRWLYAKESAGVRALERQAVEKCDAVLVVSAAEMATLGIDSPKVHVISNGVDTEYFSPGAAPSTDKATDGGARSAANSPGARQAARPSLVFVGQMDYRPNIEGVCWFVREVWPALRRGVPDVAFTIVGRNPTLAVRELAKAPGVVVTGAVPDVRPYLAAATVAIAPLQIARGIQNKVLEAMAMGRPVVGSPAALEGLDIAVGEDALAADTPTAWLETLTNLLHDGRRQHDMGRAARARVERLYTWPSRMEALVSLCQGLSCGSAAGLTDATCASVAPERPTAARLPQLLPSAPCNPGQAAANQ